MSGLNADIDIKHVLPYFLCLPGTLIGIRWKVIYEEGFLIYEEMGKCLTLYDETVIHMDFASDPFPSWYRRKFFFYFLSL